MKSEPNSVTIASTSGVFKLRVIRSEPQGYLVFANPAATHGLFNRDAARQLRDWLTAAFDLD